MTRCKDHDRLYCYDPKCKARESSDNAGRIGVDNQGDLTIGLGGGLTLDTTDGSLGMHIAPGITIDFDGQ